MRDTILLDALKRISDSPSTSAWADNLREIAEQALTDYASAPKEELRWVKASERMPKVLQQVCCRTNFNRLVIAERVGTTKKWDEYPLTNDNEKIVEWLDESSAPESGQKEGWGSEYILASAIWYKDLPTAKLLPVNIDKGIVLCGLRHAFIISTMKSVTGLRTVQFGENSVGETVQGFLTSANRFVDRQIAADIAFNAGQTKENKRELFSEDVFTQIQFTPTLDESSAPESGGEEYKRTKAKCIEFLDSIRDYERESGKAVCYDERDSEELYFLFTDVPNKSTHSTSSNYIEQGLRRPIRAIRYACDFFKVKNLNEFLDKHPKEEDQWLFNELSKAHEKGAEDFVNSNSEQELERSVATKSNQGGDADNQICKMTGERCKYICVITDCFLQDEENKKLSSLSKEEGKDEITKLHEAYNEIYRQANEWKNHSEFQGQEIERLTGLLEKVFKSSGNRVLLTD